MSRSLKKGPFVNERLLKKLSDKKPGDKSVIKTWARSSTIVPEMAGFTFGVHNGREFISVFITEEMIGHKLGEFSLTRKFIRHSGKMQKEQDAAKKSAETTSPKQEKK